MAKRYLASIDNDSNHSWKGVSYAAEDTSLIDHRMYEGQSPLTKGPPLGSSPERRTSAPFNSRRLLASDRKMVQRATEPVTQNTPLLSRSYGSQSGSYTNNAIESPDAVPGGRRRRSSQLPLTDKNLQLLLNENKKEVSPLGPGLANVASRKLLNSTTAYPDGRKLSRRSTIAGETLGNKGDVVLDMDRFQQNRRRSSNKWHDPFHPDAALENAGPFDDEMIGFGNGANNNYMYDFGERFGSDSENGGDQHYDQNSLEFGESNPSSDHSLDSTSLDDVFIDDYYNPKPGAEDSARPYNEWPDLTVLTEFIKEEFDEYAQQLEDLLDADDSEREVNFNDEAVIHPETPSGKPAFQSNKRKETLEIPKRLKSPSPAATPPPPLLQSKQVNEIEHFPTSRIRPTPIQPWQKSKTNLTFNNKKSGRFTYFREDLENTIHLTCMSGLIYADDTRLRDYSSEVIETKLRDLFVPSCYLESRRATEIEGINTNNQSSTSASASVANAERISHPPTIVNSAAINGVPMASPSGLLPAGLANASVIGSMAPTTVASSINIEEEEKLFDPTAVSLPISVEALKESETPFWLDVLDPTEEEIKVLSKTFGIHPLTTEDIFLGEAREKVELFKSYYFVCFTSFDVVYERRKQRAKEHERKMQKLQDMMDEQNKGMLTKVYNWFSRKGSNGSYMDHMENDQSSLKSKAAKKVRDGELQPLNMYMIVFKNAVITFHFGQTPHPINVRRRARLLKEYLNVSADWLCYALVDDITDSFAPLIDSIEEEVNSIEDSILKMHSGEIDLDDDSDDSEDSDAEPISPAHSGRRPKRFSQQAGALRRRRGSHSGPGLGRDFGVFYRMKRSKSTIEYGSVKSWSTKKSRSSNSSSTTSSKILGWRRKGDMLRRIGECRKRVMSVLRLLSSKADVIRGYSKRFSETTNGSRSGNEIGMYLSDIQDHIVTMLQSLLHYEKLLARFHLNYLAQINIDMTKVNNDTNDVLGKITVLGTIVLPINVVTGLWGMNCIVPGQDVDSLTWFWGIITGMILFSIFAYHYAMRAYGL